MNKFSFINNPYEEAKVIDGCSIFGVMDTAGNRMSPKGVIDAMVNMRERGNGLGAGFAGYGIYPERADEYAFHVMYLDEASKENTEEYLSKHFNISYSEEIPVKTSAVRFNAPAFLRYFVKPKDSFASDSEEKASVLKHFLFINYEIDGGFVISAGKNMGVFKGVGYPDEIAEFFSLDKYEGYTWTAHSRFPTNTPGWWGGAHPFGLLNMTVVHNGEISSYGINKRYLSSLGYNCVMQTDTEVIIYAVDYLKNKMGFDYKEISNIFAPPFWDEIERMEESERAKARVLRNAYGSLLLNGPFSMIMADESTMVGLADRIRLRPLSCGIKGSTLYLSSEESSIRLICPEVEKTWSPYGGEAVIAELGKPLEFKKYSKSRV